MQLKELLELSRDAGLETIPCCQHCSVTSQQQAETLAIASRVYITPLHCDQLANHSDYNAKSLPSPDMRQFNVVVLGGNASVKLLVFLSANVSPSWGGW